MVSCLVSRLWVAHASRSAVACQLIGVPAISGGQSKTGLPGHAWAVSFRLRRGWPACQATGRSE
eukprot:11696060-Alexandrium_andersonii.AAC.1